MSRTNRRLLALPLSALLALGAASCGGDEESPAQGDDVDVVDRGEDVRNPVAGEADEDGVIGAEDDWMEGPNPVAGEDDDDVIGAGNPLDGGEDQDG